MLAGNDAYTPAFESIATVSVGSGGTSEIEFASIPSTFTHIQLRFSTITETGGKVIIMRFNSDSGTNYTRHFLNGQGTSASAAGGTGESSIRAFGQNIGTDTASPAVGIIDILDYTNTNKYSTVRILSGMDDNGSGEIAIESSLWLNTAAISNIKFRLNDSSDFAQYSHFALYGIKAAS